MSEIWDNNYIWVFSINSKSVLLLALVRYTLCSHFTQNCAFWRLKILALWRKIVENLLIFVYLFCIKNGVIDFTKTFITQEWLTVESDPSLNHIFNALSIGVQHTLLFQLPNFGLKCLPIWSSGTRNLEIFKWDPGPGTPKEDVNQ